MSAPEHVTEAAPTPTPAPAERPRREGWLRARKRLVPYLLVVPGLVFLGVLMLYPMAEGLLSGFFEQQPGQFVERDFVGLDNFRRLAQDTTFRSVFGNTMVWVFGSVGLSYVVGLVTAVLLNRSFPGRGVLRSAMLVPWVVPFIAAALTWQWMYSAEFGVINHILLSIGLIDAPVNWLGSRATALPAVIITNVWKTVPFVAVVLLARLQAIEQELYDSAAVEGASAWQAFRHITFPHIRNISAVLVILTGIWTYNQFDLVYLMTAGGPANASQIIPVFTYLNAFGFLRFNYAAAMATVSVVILAVIILPVVRRLARGEH